jgi:hypothetical protein
MIEAEFKEFGKWVYHKRSFSLNYKTNWLLNKYKATPKISDDRALQIDAALLKLKDYNETVHEVIMLTILGHPIKDTAKRVGLSESKTYRLMVQGDAWLSGYLERDDQ